MSRRIYGLSHIAQAARLQVGNPVRIGRALRLAAIRQAHQLPGQLVGITRVIEQPSHDDLARARQPVRLVAIDSGRINALTNFTQLAQCRK